MLKVYMCLFAYLTIFIESTGNGMDISVMLITVFSRSIYEGFLNIFVVFGHLVKFWEMVGAGKF